PELTASFMCYFVLTSQCYFVLTSDIVVLSLGHDRDTELSQCLRVGQGWAAAHRLGGVLYLRERDHVADIVEPEYQHHKAVKTERHAGVRRNAVLEGFEQEAELFVSLLVRHAEQVEHLRLDLGVVYTHRTAAGFGAVDDDV